MKLLIRTCLLFVFSAVLVSSCSADTEKIARKESGKEFGPWAIIFNPDRDYVYWPDLKLIEPIEGELIGTENDSYFIYSATKTEHFESSARLHIYITRLYKESTGEGTDVVFLKLTNDEDRYYNHSGMSIPETRFVFNRNRSDSLSFVGYEYSKGYCGVFREDYERLIGLLSRNDEVTLDAHCVSSNHEVDFTFSFNGSRKLADALDLLHRRYDMAYRESKSLKR